MNSSSSYVVLGSGSGVGKTLVSAILMTALSADYWNPISTESLEEQLRFLQVLPQAAARVHPPAYHLTHPEIPQLAAYRENLELEIDRLNPPLTERPLIIELSGSVVDPLNQYLRNLDLLLSWKVPVIMVCTYHSLSISQCLLSLEVLHQHDVNLAGLILSGKKDPDHHRLLTQHARIPILGEIPFLSRVDFPAIKKLSRSLRWAD